LRWRPDRIILGEVRGIEGRTVLDSFNTGHAGSLATIHANSAEKAFHRFANLVIRNHAQTTFTDTEAEIGESVDFGAHIERQPGGSVVREVLRMIGYDRDTKRFLIEPVFEVQHAQLNHAIQVDLAYEFLRLVSRCRGETSSENHS
jgi:pilus assembly protein CpaF